VLVAAAVVPHPPLLIPAVGGADGAPELAAVRVAAIAAVRALVAAEPDLLLLVGDAPVPLDVTGGAGSLAAYGVPIVVRLGAGGPPLPLSLTVGAWLLGEAGAPAGPVRAVGVPRAMTAREAVPLGAARAEAAPRVALMVLGDGSACRTARAPGAFDPRAQAYDDGVARALADADPAALLALDPGLSDALLVAGRASWQVLAGAAGPAPAAAAAGRWAGRVTAHAAPYGVGYLVATWDRAA